MVSCKAEDWRLVKGKWRNETSSKKTLMMRMLCWFKNYRDSSLTLLTFWFPPDIIWSSDTSGIKWSAYRENMASLIFLQCSKVIKSLNEFLFSCVSLTQNLVDWHFWNRKVVEFLSKCDNALKNHFSSSLFMNQFPLNAFWILPPCKVKSHGLTCISQVTVSNCMVLHNCQYNVVSLLLGFAAGF